MSRRLPAVVVGDWNLPAEAVGDIAHAIGGHVQIGRRPDHAIVRAARVVRSIRVRDKHGSDHHYPIVLDLMVRGVELRILYWNVWSGQTPADVQRQLASLIDTHAPQVVMLSEAYKLRVVLGRVPGFRRFQGLNIGEGADVALLVRRDIKVSHHGVLRMAQRWRGPLNGKPYAPRRYRRVRLELGPDVSLRLLGVHFPPGPRVNGKAVRESTRRVIRWGVAS